METSQSFKELLNDYSEIYDRSSAAVCRVAIDLILCECIAQMTPKPAAKIKVQCDIPFSHKINTQDVVVDGRACCWPDPRTNEGSQSMFPFSSTLHRGQNRVHLQQWLRATGRLPRFPSSITSQPRKK